MHYYSSALMSSITFRCFFEFLKCCFWVHLATSMATIGCMRQQSYLTNVIRCNKSLCHWFINFVNWCLELSTSEIEVSVTEVDAPFHRTILREKTKSLKALTPPQMMALPMSVPNTSRTVLIVSVKTYFSLWTQHMWHLLYYKYYYYI